MKALSSLTRFFPVALALAVIVGVFGAIGSAYGLLAAAGTYLALNSIAGQLLGVHRMVLGPTTLTSTEVLADVLDAFKTRVPALNRFGTDFGSGVLKLNQTYIAHVAGIPTISTYNAASGGYANGAVDSRGLLIDVPVVVSNHPTAPLLWNHIDQIKDKKNEYTKVIGNAGYALAVDMVNKIGTGITSRNFSYERVVTVANFDYDELMNITGDANTNGMMSTGRTLLVSTAAANVLFADDRIIRSEYSGQMVEGEGIRYAKNVGGFAEIIEWPGMPTNNGASALAITGVAATNVITSAAHGLLAGDPVIFPTLSGGAGLTAGTTKYYARDITTNTFTVSATRGGAAVDFTTDIASGTVRIDEALHAFAFDSRAICLKAGVPEGMTTSAIAQQLGIPESVLFDLITDVDPDTGTGLTLAAAKWQGPGTANFYWVPTFVWGASLGKQSAGTAAGELCDKAGLRILSR